MRKPKRYYHRAWLNKKVGTAFVEASATPTEHLRYPSVDAQLTLSDCVRTITLDFDVYVPENGNVRAVADEKLDKIDGLIQELLVFRDHLENQYFWLGDYAANREEAE